MPNNPNVFPHVVFLYTACPIGFSRHSSSCYYISTTLLNRADAQTTCESFKSNLVTITSSKEDAFVQSLAVGEGVAVDFWIGIKGRDVDFKWMDGSPVAFDYFDWDDPYGPFNEGTDCIRLRDFTALWNDIFCDHHHRSICEGSVGDPFCSGVSDVFGSSCYTKILTTMTRDAARANCESDGGHLVYIETEAEHNYLLTSGFSGDEGKYWIGLTKRVSGSNDDLLMWMSGEPLRYTNFGYIGGGTECFQLADVDGYSVWRTDGCASWTTNGFICEFKRERSNQFVAKQGEWVPALEDIIDDVIRSSVGRCASSCMSNLNCESLAYTRLNGTCLLSRNSAGTLTQREGFVFYIMTID
nr:macrophage mannose receptor 1-like [Lytechinus pictus]